MSRRLIVRVHGRPAPQGSKTRGRGDTLLESSVYLPAWRAAVRRDSLDALVHYAGRPPLPYFPADVGVVIEECSFIVTDEQCRAGGTDNPIGKPDIDKLLRSTLDALGGSPKVGAKVFADDSQVVQINILRKLRATATRGPGALIILRGTE